MVETAAPIDEVVAVSVAMLTDLRDKELGLLELILAHLPPPTLVEIAATCAFLRTCALSSTCGANAGRDSQHRVSKGCGLGCR